ncbi:L-type lectin-domain containing receptor kinase IV.1 [Triticum urartu]|uniref:non-specific serine/threonine protein kinase n=1 Tax=Triticum urartu TaxID=4572 RepID=M7YU88_TRIUA|nr:L-type lectin-domain containing receptor kinase IV.1 [Triticum urartu]
MLLHPHHLVPLLLLLVAAASGDGVQFSYNGFAGVNLTLDGAVVMPNGLLMLTNGTIQTKGQAFHPSPLPFRGGGEANGTGDGAARSFSTTFVFAIFGQYADLSSHGMAFFVSASRELLSTAMPGQFLGLLNDTDGGNRSDHIFAVELDTLFNAEFRDINSNHVGVDVDSLVSVRSADAGYYDDGTGTFRNLSLISREAMQVWVDYDGGATEVAVTVAPLGMARPKKPLLTTTVDLSPVVQSTMLVGFSSATALAALVLVLGIGVYIFVRRLVKFSELREDWEDAFGPHRFSYKELYHATKGFSDKNLLGAGGFGSVYRGKLRKPDMEVAVKRVSHESRQGMKEFVAEVASIGRLRHRNLVPLLGYCRRKGELLLVYDYMPNGSLDKYLYDASSTGTLDWPQRFHIIRGVASGLLYLHEDWEQVVIHRDVKASNILLDSEMNGRLGDFGLARLYDHGTDAHTTHVVGTMGYLAPELGHTGKATPSTDVFAFGAFLLEITCGRRPIEQNEHDNRIVLVDWVIEQWRKGLIIGAVDTRIPSGFSPDMVSLVLKLALLCSHPLPNGRPTMRQVMQYLDGDMVLPDLSSAYLSFTMLERMYDGDFNQKMLPYESSTSMGAVSDISGGR